MSPPALTPTRAGRLAGSGFFGRSLSLLAAASLACFSLAASPAGPPPEAPAGLTVALPAGCSFYAALDFQRDPDLRPAFLVAFPSVGNALRTLAARSVLGPPDRLSGLAFAGRLQAEPVNMVMLIAGDLGQSARGAEPDPAWTSSARAAGRPVYRFRESAPGAPPVAFVILAERVLAVGRQEVLLEVFGRQPPQGETPGLFRKLRAGPGAATLYVGPALLPHLLSLDPSTDSWQTLRRLLDGFTEFAWNLDPRRSGAGELVLVCRQARTAAEVGTLLQNFFTLAILSSGEAEADTRAIMESLRIHFQDREIRVHLTIPPATLQNLFAPSTQ